MAITWSKFQSLCNLHDEGTFMAKCGQWLKTEKTLVEIQNGGPDLFDEISEATMLHKEDKRASALRERVFGRHCNVQDKFKVFFEAEQNKKWTNEHVERRVRCAHCLSGRW